MNQYTLSKKLFIWIFLSTIVPVVVLTTIYLVSFRASLLSQEKEHLSQLADKKVEQVEVYISQRIDDAQLLSKSVQSEQLLADLIPLYKHKQKQTQAYYLKEKIHRSFFQDFKERGYFDIFLISPEGDIVFSLIHESDFATNIYRGEYRNSGLGSVVKRASYFLEASSSSFEYYSPSGEAAAFVAAPILRAGKLIGIVALQVDYNIIQDVTLDLGGSKESREVVVASKHGNYFSYQTRVKYDPSIEVGRELPIAELPYPLYKAMGGERSTAVELDYRNVKVIAASRYLPSMHWGMVFKEDYSEAMQVFDRLMYFSIAALVSISFGALILARYLGQAVAKPLVNMTKATRAIAQGDMDLTVELEGFKESFELAESFNKMSGRLKDARNNLEHKVIERTFELEQEMKLRKKNEMDLENSYLEINRSMLHLKTAQDQLIESEKMASLGSLVAGIAHEINTPLGIAITSNGVLKSTLNEMEKDLNNKTLTQGVFKEHLIKMNEIESLLDNNLGRTVTLVKNFKQVAVDQTNLHKAKFYLFELVESLLASLLPETKRHPVEIINDVRDDIVIDSYSGDFYQLLTNLILNAMVHAFEGKEKGKLIISARLKGDIVTLSVSDDGNGIPEESLSSIFEPFFTTRRGAGGSGLGLSIVHNIVKQKLKGDIEVHSTINKGTEFVVRFANSLP